MPKTINPSYVSLREELKDTYIKKTGRFLFWKTEWWEKINTEHIANDIVINSDRPIRSIIVNGKIIILSDNHSTEK